MEVANNRTTNPAPVCVAVGRECHGRLRLAFPNAAVLFQLADHPLRVRGDRIVPGNHQRATAIVTCGMFAHWIFFPFFLSGFQIMHYAWSSRMETLKRSRFSPARAPSQRKIVTRNSLQVRQRPPARLTSLCAVRRAVAERICKVRASIIVTTRSAWVRRWRGCQLRTPQRKWCSQILDLCDSRRGGRRRNCGSGRHRNVVDHVLCADLQRAI
jgi:hypothetical protein